MFRFGHRGPNATPRVSRKLCTNRYTGRFPTVGLYDCTTRQTWVCRPLNGQAIRTSHAALITGTSNATSTAWKDRFICFWFFTPGTGEGYIHGYPIEWDEAHLLIRVDPNWDYDRQRLIPDDLLDHVEANLARQFRHADAIIAFFRDAHLKYPFNVHFIAQRAAHSQFYARRIEPPSSTPR